jgi:hypothetical protein
VLPEVVAQEGGKARGVNYAHLVAVLVEAVKGRQATNEKDHRTIEEQLRTIDRQKAELDNLKSRLETLEALVQGR